MTELNPSLPPARPARWRPSLYRTVLSLGIAAIAAAWLPFSILYINALSNHPTSVSATPALHAPSGTSRAPATTLAAVTTRTS